MAMTLIWTGMVLAAVLCGALCGRGEAVAAAIPEGAAAAVQLGLALAGTLCLWSGVMEVMRASGMAEGLARLLAPVLGRLFPGQRGEGGAMDSISANVSANLLGLGSAATPLGVRAVQEMGRGRGRATDEICLFVVCNTASIQLLPTTVAAVRAGAGCSTPFDILPAVWITSGLSAGLGMGFAAVLGKLWPRD